MKVRMLVLFMFLFAANPVFAQVVISPHELTDFKFNDVKLLELLEVMRKNCSINWAMGAGIVIRPEIRITVNHEGRPCVDMFRLVLETQGLTYELTNGIYLIATPATFESIRIQRVQLQQKLDDEKRRMEADKRQAEAQPQSPQQDAGPRRFETPVVTPPVTQPATPTVTPAVPLKPSGRKDVLGLEAQAIEAQDKMPVVVQCPIVMNTTHTISKSGRLSSRTMSLSGTKSCNDGTGNSVQRELGMLMQRKGYRVVLPKTGGQSTVRTAARAEFTPDRGRRTTGGVTILPLIAEYTIAPELSVVSYHTDMQAIELDKFCDKIARNTSGRVQDVADVIADFCEYFNVSRTSHRIEATLTMGINDNQGGSLRPYKAFGSLDWVAREERNSLATRRITTNTPTAEALIWELVAGIEKQMPR